MPDMLKRINQIFADQIYRVPDYQRGYAWEKPQWNDLLEDIDLLPDDRTHFTGTLILRSYGNNQEKILDRNMQAYDVFDIIDGQQRLTTIVIILKSIYDEFLTFPQLRTLAERLSENYLNTYDLNGQPFSKLSLNEDSNKFFSDNILDLHPGISGPTIRSHQRLLEALEYFKAYLKRNREEKGDDYLDWLQAFYRKVTLQLTLIVYPLENEQDAGTIFETMNDRGRPLTELEKVKNYLLYISAKLDLQASHDLTVNINSTLKYVYEHLMAAGLASRANEDQLLRTHWLLIYDYNVTHWDNARSIKNRFGLRTYQNRHVELLADLKQYLGTLHDTVTAYCDIHNPTRDGAFNNISDSPVREEIILWSKKLVRLGVRASYLPLLIAVRLKAGDNGSAYLKTLQFLENFTFRVFYWRRARSNAGQTSFFRLGYLYYQNPNTDWTLEEIAQLGLRYCPKETFEERFKRETENWYDWSGINYFLYEYEHFLAGGHPVELTWETLSDRPKASSIEHILPQTPQDAYWLERFTLEQQIQWKHDLANLTLTYDNSSLGNRRFPLKKGAPGKKGTYADSPLFIERDLAAFQDWTVENLEERRLKMIAWAQNRWKVDSIPRKNEKNAKTIEGMIEYAEEFDLGEELQAIHQVATRLKMWPTIRKNIQYRHPNNYRLSTIVVAVQAEGFTVYFYHENFAEYPGVTLAEVTEVLDVNRGWNWFPRERISEAIDALNRFEAFLKAKNE